MSYNKLKTHAFCWLTGMAIASSAWGSETCSADFIVDSVNGVSGNCVDLLAGQHIDAGDVCFSIDGDNNLIIDYSTQNGFELEEVHAWAGTNLADMPQTRKGNPKVGNFPYKSGDITGQTSYSFSIPLGSLGNSILENPCLFCENPDLALPQILAATHAAVRRDNGDGTYQTETGWGDGGPLVDRGSWATYTEISLDVVCDEPPPPPPEEECETAFAYPASGDTCFLDMDMDGDGTRDFSRWGWSIGPVAEGDYVFDIYAGAGQCDISKGELVGQLSVSYQAGTAIVMYTAAAGFHFDETHLYIGSEPLARDVNGEYTVAPGQYPNIHELNHSESDIFVVSGLSGSIFIVAHSVSCSITE